MNHPIGHGVMKNFTENEWDDIEQKVSPQALIVAHGMISFGEQIYKTGNYISKKTATNNFQINNLSKIILEKFSEKFIKIIPESLFQKITEMIAHESQERDSSEKKKKKKKNDKKKQNSGQQMKEHIRLRTILKRIEEDLEFMDNTTSEILVESQFTLIESRLLNYLVWFFKISSSHKRKPNSYIIYDCLLSLSRAIDYFQKNYIGISEDIFSYCSQVLTFGVSGISIQELQIKYPELITQSSFDRFSYQSTLKLYDCQKEVLLNIYNSLVSKQPVILNYQTPPGAGKTTLVLALSRIVLAFGKQVIYVCYNDIVRKEVSKMLFHSGTTFAIVSDCHIKPHDSCFVSKKNKGRPCEHEDKSLRLNSELARIKSKCDKQPTVLVCDLTSAVLLLKTLDAQEKYVAYIDEPTAGAEDSDSLMTYKYMEIILSCPAITVCLSATMPKNEETLIIYDNFKSRFKCDDEHIKTVLSSLIPINCEVIDGQGNIVCPHNLVQSVQQLQEVVSFMEEKPFLTRFYTSKILYRLRNILEEYPDYDLKSYEPSLSDLNHSNTREECLKLLKIMIQINSPELIKQLQVRIPLSESGEIKGFDFETCLGSTAHHNLGQTLLINEDSKCHDLVLIQSQKFLQENQCPTLKTQFKEYDKHFQDYKKKLVSIEKNKNIKGEDENSRARDNLEPPSFDWNPSLTVNTIEHLNAYSGLKSKELQKYEHFMKLCPLSQGLNIDLIKELPDIYDAGLLMGIGVIDPSSSLLSSNGNIYNQEILKLASQGYLSYISSNRSISYGTNFPIQKVVIDNTGQSQNTLHQQLGRVGRLGKSLSGCAVICEEDIIRLAFTSIEQNIEAEHMNQAAEKILTSA